MEELIMDISAIVNQALEFAKNLTGFLGEFEAAGIIDQVKNFLAGIDLSAITNLLNSITGIFGA